MEMQNFWYDIFVFGSLTVQIINHVFRRSSWWLLSALHQEISYTRYSLQASPKPRTVVSANCCSGCTTVRPPWVSFRWHPPQLHTSTLLVVDVRQIDLRWERNLLQGLEGQRLNGIQLDAIFRWELRQREISRELSRPITQHRDSLLIFVPQWCDDTWKSARDMINCPSMCHAVQCSTIRALNFMPSVKRRQSEMRVN